METVVIVIHLMVILALIAVVLLQRSEGGALGIGGGGGNFMGARGQGNILTRATTILGIAFFGTSILLTVIARLNAPPSSILDLMDETAPPITTEAPLEPGATTSGTATSGTGAAGILDELEASGLETGQPDAAAPTEVPTSQ